MDHDFYSIEKDAACRSVEILHEKAFPVPGGLSCRQHSWQNRNYRLHLVVLYSEKRQILAASSFAKEEKHGQNDTKGHKEGHEGMKIPGVLFLFDNK